MAHFSKFMRPGAVKIGCTLSFQPEKLTVNKSEQDAQNSIVATAVQNPDGSFAIALFNPTVEKYNISIKIKNEIKKITIDAKALQTIVLK
jgi:glucosylceramidase